MRHPRLSERKLQKLASLNAPPVKDILPSFGEEVLLLFIYEAGTEYDQVLKTQARESSLLHLLSLGI
jgi:hypothetical protein